jgi:hypothetical protein
MTFLLDVIVTLVVEWWLTFRDPPLRKDYH